MDRHKFPLTSREVQVLTLCAQGFTFEAIASQLGVSGRTVNGHVKRIGLKLGSRGRASIIFAAAQMGLLTDEALYGSRVAVEAIGVERADSLPTAAGQKDRFLK